MLLAHYSLPRLRAALALTRRKPAESISELEQARLYRPGDYYALTELGSAYMRVGKPDMAAGACKAILAAAAGIDAGAPLYNLAHLRLARAYAMQNQTSESRHEYEQFLQLWNEADADLPLLKQARVEFDRLEKRK